MSHASHQSASQLETSRSSQPDRLAVAERGFAASTMGAMVQSRQASGLTSSSVVAMRGQSAGRSPSAPTVRQIAKAGVAGASSAIPHQRTLQKAFGRHDVSSIKAQVGGAAGQAAQQMGAQAYATGNRVAFGSQPDLHTAAHEAAHVVQQRAGISVPGGVGAVGDRYEKHADAVADKVVAGQSAEGLLDELHGRRTPQKAASDGPVQRLATRGDFADGQIASISPLKDAVVSSLTPYGKGAQLATIQVGADPEAEHAPETFMQAAQETVNTQEEEAAAPTHDKAPDTQQEAPDQAQEPAEPQVQMLALFDSYIGTCPESPSAEQTQTQSSPPQVLLAGDVARDDQGRTNRNPYYQVAFQNPVSQSAITEIDTLLAKLEQTIFDLDEIAITLDEDILLAEGNIRDDLMEGARKELADNKQFVNKKLGDIRQSIDSVRKAKQQLKTEIPLEFANVVKALEAAAAKSEENKRLLAQERDSQKLKDLNAEVAGAKSTITGAFGLLFDLSLEAAKPDGNPATKLYTTAGKLALGLTVGTLYEMWTAPQREALANSVEGHKAAITTLRQEQADALKAAAEGAKKLVETKRDNLIKGIQSDIKTITLFVNQLTDPKLTELPATSRVFAALADGTNNALQKGTQLSAKAAPVSGEASEIMRRAALIDGTTTRAEAEIERRRLKKHGSINPHTRGFNPGVDTEAAKKTWSAANSAIQSWAGDVYFEAEMMDFHATDKAELIAQASHLETFEALGVEVSELVSGGLPEDWLTVLFGAL